MFWQFEITYNSVTTTVDEPVGWSTVKFIKKRDPEFKGVFFEFSTELSFYGSAYDTIMSAYNADDLAADVTVTIKQRRVEWKAYTTFFTGKVLFEEFSYDDTHANVILEKNDVLRKLKNKIDKTVEITANKTVTLHSLPIIYAAEFDSEDAFNYSKSTSHAMPLSPTLEEIGTLIPVTDRLNTTPFFYNGDVEERTIVVTGSLSIRALDPADSFRDAGVKITLDTKEVGGAGSTTVTLYDTITTTIQHTHSVTINQTITVKPNYNIFLRASSKTNNNLSTDTSWTYLSGSSITIEEETLSNPIVSSCKGVTFHEAFSQVCTDIGVSYTSTAMQATDKTAVLLTNGYNVRRQNQVIKVTFKEVFNLAKTLFKVGLRVSGTSIEIADDSDIFSASTLQTISSHSKVFTKVKKDLAISKLVVGTTQTKIDDGVTNNFAYEFNTVREYELQEVRTAGKTDERLDCILSGVLIETIRRRKLHTTNSYREDDKLVVISLNRTGVSDSVIYGSSTTYGVGTVAERNESLTVTNYKHLSRVYNARFSPRRLALNVLDRYYLGTNNVYDFVTGEGNNDVTISSTAENDSIGTTPFNFVTPMSYEFVTEVVLTSEYLQVSTNQMFIEETEETIEGKYSVVAIKKM